MLSKCQRFYRIIQFQMFTIFVAMVLTPLTTRGEPYAPRLELSEVRVQRPVQRPAEQGQRAHWEAPAFLDLSYDLRDTVKWTTKEVYLGLVAVWEDEAGVQEQTIWDRTVYHTDVASFRASVREPAKYPLRTYEGGALANRTLSFRFVLHEVGFGGPFRKTWFETAVEATVPGE